MRTNFSNTSPKITATRFLMQLICNRLRFGALPLVLMLLFLNVQVFAVCQTPQFGNPVTITVNNPYSAAPADYNRDGRTDLAVLSNADGAIEIFLGNGTGFVSTGTRYTAQQSSVGDIASGDFNNDGILDLVATGGPSTQRVAAILIGNGSGGFGPPTNFSVGSFPASVKTADFNNDGNIDIITANNSSQTVSILPGQGNGTFTAAFSVAVNGSPESVIVADFNGDGRNDFVTVDGDSDTATIKLGNGNFTFNNPSPAVITLPDPRQLNVNDFNRDGKLDFAATNFFEDNISVRLGAGTGVFNLPSGDPFAVAVDPLSITSADLNSDGFPDIATGNNGSGGSDNVSILLNNGIGGFSSSFNFTITNGISPKIYAVDFNQNGVSDLVVLKEDTTDRLVLVPNTCPPPTKAKFDYDADGKADVSVFRPSTGAWYLQRSVAGFTGVTFGQNGDTIAPADYDGDGRADIAVFRNGFWYLQRSSQGFTGIQFGASGDLPRPADFDGDGKAEIAVFRPSTGTWYWLNSSNNQFNAYQFGQNGDAPIIADFNGDAKDDVGVFRPSNGTWYWINSATGIFRSLQFGASGDTPVPADYSGDGRDDIAVFRPSNGGWYIYNTASGQVSSIGFGVATDIPVPADFDGDGKADQAVFRPSNGAWYLNRSTQGFTGVSFGAGTDKPTPAAFLP